jgi:hypothetical protein
MVLLETVAEDVKPNMTSYSVKYDPYDEGMS